jgi:hypothetical protein
MKDTQIRYFGLLRLVLMFSIMLIAGIAAQLNGLFGLVLDNDPTGISLGIYGLFILGSFIALLATIKTTYLVQCRPLVQVCWFMSDIVLSLGMIGTIVAFIQMFATANLAGVSTGDSASMMELIGVVAKSMSLALYTTLVGLISSVLLKVQCLNLDHMYGVRDAN